MSDSLVLNDRYRLEERLGSGGMAVVYRAWDLTLERVVAIKLLRQDYSDAPEFRQRFRHEARAAAGLSHPNLATIHDFGLYQDRLFIVMEFVPGEDLKALLRQHGRFEVAEAIYLIIQACSGLGLAHRAGLIHCDVKPQNLLVTPDGRLKIVDFGIARALASISPNERSEVVWGSPQYFSPEQASGLPPSPASDVYSLGVVMYEMLAGRLPFTSSNADELARQHRDLLPPSPTRYNPAIPTGLEQVLLKVLSKEPSQRYRSADQFGRALSSLSQANYPPAAPLPGGVSAQPVAAFAAAATAAPKAPPQTTSRPGLPANSRPMQVARPAPGQPEAAAGPRPAQPASQTGPDLMVISPPRRPAAFDWLTWTLALLALIAAGGLLPFWLWVIYILNPPL